MMRISCAIYMRPGRTILGLLVAGCLAAASPASVRSNQAPVYYGPELYGSVTREPGYYPPADPESASVRIGRRLNAPLVSKPFRGGARSLSELGRRICTVLEHENSDSLLMLTVREDEFRDIMWAEFPQSRPATGVQWEDAWRVLSARLHGGAGYAVKEFGQHTYKFVRWDRTVPTSRYKNFNLLSGLHLVVEDETGQQQDFTWLRTVAERKGVYKIYSLKD